MPAIATTPVDAQLRVAHPREGLGSRLLHAAGRFALRWSRDGFSEDVAQTATDSAYRDWRRRELESQLRGHFDVGQITDRDLLDFGCGTGPLSFLLSACGARSVIGVDASFDAIEQAQLALSTAAPAQTSSVRFVHADDPQRIPIDDSRVDLICCFDVLEHVADVPAMLAQWRRVLRPAGRVWIWWSPWRGPYGHHVRSLIPLPWFHLLFSERAIFDACARIYDSPDFVPRQWDIDRATGARKPNKWRGVTSFAPFLNQLTRRAFERMLPEAGFTIRRREMHGFSGSFLRRATRVATGLPGIGECLVSFFIYELVATPAGQETNRLPHR